MAGKERERERSQLYQEDFLGTFFLFMRTFANPMAGRVLVADLGKPVPHWPQMRACSTGWSRGLRNALLSRKSDSAGGQRDLLPLLVRPRVAERFRSK
jgi:hypothetical protein